MICRKKLYDELSVRIQLTRYLVPCRPQRSAPVPDLPLLLWHPSSRTEEEILPDSAVEAALPRGLKDDAEAWDFDLCQVIGVEVPPPSTYLPDALPCLKGLHPTALRRQTIGRACDNPSDSPVRHGSSPAGFHYLEPHTRYIYRFLTDSMCWCAAHQPISRPVKHTAQSWPLSPSGARRTSTFKE